MRRTILVLAWALASVVAGVVLWVPLGSIGHGLAGAGARAIVPISFLFLLYSTPLGLRALVYGMPILTILFGLWAMLCKRRPAWDSPRPLMLFACLIALPGAFVISATCAQSPDPFSFRAFAWLLPSYFLILWGAITCPRWLVPSLATGVFNQQP